MVWVTRQVLQVWEPAALELSRQAAAGHGQQERSRLQEQRHQRLNRSRCASDLAARQDQGVVPENRGVAR